MNNFEKTGYTIVKNAIGKEVAQFIFNAFIVQRNSVDFLYNNNILNSKNDTTKDIFGTFGDTQIPNKKTFSKYGDPINDTLMLKLLPQMMNATGFELIPTYSYYRIYQKGDELKKHKDRPSCEISSTIFLGGEEWPLSLNSLDGKKVEVKLDVGDMLIYKGCELEHWREPYTKNLCVQSFLHYNNVNGPFGRTNLFDKRPTLGVPAMLKKQ